MHGATVRSLRLARAEPHAVLAVAVAAVLAAEAGYDRHTSDVWIFLQALVAGTALLYAWRTRERLRLVPVLALALVFEAGWVALHLGLGVRGDFDSRGLYRIQGESLLHGHYPRSEYPPGAVLLFALEAVLGGGATRTTNALLMIPFQLVSVACVWATRTRYSAWLAAALAVWPLNAFFWEFKFDLVSAALLLAGLVLALRERWGLAGLALGAGAAMKWTPGFAAAALLVWLLASGRGRAAVRHVGAFALVVALFHVPFLVWSPSNLLAAFTRQGGRSITAESVWFLPLHWLGLARVHGHISFGAGVPHWANALAITVQALLVLATIAACALVRGRLRPAVALAALAPVVFLASNRIYSPQYMVLFAGAWAFVGALVARDEREQLAVGIAAGLATIGNVFVYPFALPHYVVTWQASSLLLFVVSFALTVWLAARALRLGPEVRGV